MEPHDETIKKLESLIGLEIEKSTEIIENFNNTLQTTLDLLDKFHSTVKKGLTK